jgi:hypothetical protein
MFVKAVKVNNHFMAVFFLTKDLAYFGFLKLPNKQQYSSQPSANELDS